MPSVRACIRAGRPEWHAVLRQLTMFQCPRCGRASMRVAAESIILVTVTSRFNALGAGVHPCGRHAILRSRADGRFQCPRCGRASMRVSRSTSHASAGHWFQCPRCGRASDAGVRFRLVGRWSQQFQCPRCGRASVRVRDRRHRSPAGACFNALGAGVHPCGSGLHKIMSHRDLQAPNAETS